MANAAVELLKPNLACHPDKAVYFCGERSLSFAELDRASRSFAVFLRREGIVPGERVVIALPDSLAFPVVFLGCLLAGALVVAVSSDTQEAELAQILGECGARLVVTHPIAAASPPLYGAGIKVVVCGDDSLPETAEAGADFSGPFQPSPGDLAYMLYSSGSTGRPKGVPHRHESLLLPCDLVGKAILGIDSEDVIFSTSKLSFAYGLINSLALPLRFGATAILHPGKPDPHAVLDIIRRRRPSVFFAVPTVYAGLVLTWPERELRLPMRICCSAGERLSPLLFEEWRRITGLEIVDGVGSTEMAYHFLCNVPGEAVAGSAGRLVPGYEARLVDGNGDDVAREEPGELLIKGPTGAQFYWDQPALSAQIMRGDGFIRTGDLFEEHNGCYYHRGRSDDMIKSDGRWVSPVVVEEALASHPAVAECAVAPVSVGTLVKPGAFVVLSPKAGQSPALARELRDHLQARLPAYMCPVRIRFVAALPRGTTGKVQRFRLREL